MLTTAEAADTMDPSTNSTGTSAAPLDRMLVLAWQRQRRWSLAATAARARLDRWRLVNLVLLVLGALAGAMAAQSWLAVSAAKGFAIAAAILLAIAGFIQGNALKTAQFERWTKVRAASEALKADVYRYLLRVPPYAHDDRAKTLKVRLDDLDQQIQSISIDDHEPDDRAVPPVTTFEQYVTNRAQQQMNWHKGKHPVHAAQARRLRIWQIVATFAGVVLSAVAGVDPSWGLSIWTASATTIAAVFGTHLAATQHQRIAQGYAATVGRLERLIASIDPATSTPGQQAQFVTDVEQVLIEQNEGWLDLFSPRDNGTR